MSIFYKIDTHTSGEYIGGVSQEGATSREALQNNLIEEVLRGVSSSLKSSPQGTKQYRLLAAALMAQLEHDVVEHHSMQTLRQYVMYHIHHFTESEAERRYLVQKVLDRVLDTLRADIAHDYHREQLMGPKKN